MRGGDMFRKEQLIDCKQAARELGLSPCRVAQMIRRAGVRPAEVAAFKDAMGRHHAKRLWRRDALLRALRGLYDHDPAVPDADLIDAHEAARVSGFALLTVYKRIQRAGLRAVRRVPSPRG